MNLPLLAALLVAGVFLAVSFYRWEFAIYALFVYIPISGAVDLWFPDQSWLVLAKDFIFVVPAYLSFFLVSKRRARLPVSVSIAIGFFAILVLAQCLNPAGPSLLARLTGAKVWLFYVPLAMVGSAMIRNQGDLTRLLRLLVILSWLPCVVGIAQWFSSTFFGYQATMTWFYGDQARSATQEFQAFDVGGQILRIPSTFSFPLQFFNFLLAMAAISYAAGRLDPSPSRRKLARITLTLIVIAALFSGIKSAFLMLPLLFGLTYTFNGEFMKFFRVAVPVTAIAAVAFWYSGVDLQGLAQLISGLTFQYGETNTISYIAEWTTTLGVGVGGGTNAARYVAERATLLLPENEYAKAGFEMGVAGLIAVVLLFAILIISGYQSYRRLINPALRAVAAAFLALLITTAVYCLKNTILDYDPLNMTFWFFLGVLLKLPKLESAAQAPFLRKRRGGKRVRATAGRSADGCVTS